MSLFMFIKNKFVSLCKGQDQGESSLSGNVVKSIMSPRSEQNGVSPDYVPMSCVDNPSDLIFNKKYSCLFYGKSGRGGCFFVVDDIIKFDKNDVVKIVSGILVLINLRDFEKYKRQFHTMFWEYGRLSCCLNRDIYKFFAVEPSEENNEKCFYEAYCLWYVGIDFYVDAKFGEGARRLGCL